MFDDCQTVPELRARYTALATRHREDSELLGIINEDYLRRLEAVTEAAIGEELRDLGVVRTSKTRGRPRLRHINEAGLNLLKSREQLRLKAYRDQGGVLTIGWGHTGADVKEGMTITEAKANELLKQDLSAAERAVSDLVYTALSNNRFDAVVCLVFNIGRTAFSQSTMRKCLNAADWKGASAQFPVWNKVRDRRTGKLFVSNGLVNRRREERELFDTP